MDGMEPRDGTESRLVEPTIVKAVGPDFWARPPTVPRASPPAEEGMAACGQDRDGGGARPADEPEIEAIFVDDAQRDLPVGPATASAIQPEIADLAELSGPEKPPAHGSGCDCLSCRWGHFEAATSATEPDAVLHAYFCDVVQQVLQDLSHPAAPTALPPATESPGGSGTAVVRRSDTATGLRRLLSRRDRR